MNLLHFSWNIKINIIWIIYAMLNIIVIKVGIRIRDFLFQHLSECTLWSKLVSGLRY